MILAVVDTGPGVTAVLLQTLIVVAAAFGVIGAVISYLRYQQLVRQAGQRGMVATDYTDSWPVTVSGYLTGVQRQPEPFSVVTFASPTLDEVVQHYSEELAEEIIQHLVERIRRHLRAEFRWEHDAVMEEVPPPADVVLRTDRHRIGAVIQVERARVRGILERLGEDLHRDAFRGSSGLLVKPVLHAGVASFPENGELAGDLIRQAGENLDRIDAAAHHREHRVSVTSMPEGTPEPEIEEIEIERPAGVVDDLTGVLRSDRLGPALQKFVARHRKFDQPVALLYLDIDALDQYNRHYGRAAGDEILRTIGRVLELNTREDDLIGRVEDDEFVIALSCCPGGEALLAAQRIAQVIKGEHVSHENSGLRVTVSIGIAAYPDDGVVAKQLYLRSERALLSAKVKGRNFCVRYHPRMERRRARKPTQPQESF